MSIVFYCQNCGARFDVDDRAAGKQGRCKHCRQKMVVPQAGTLASLAATPHLAMAAATAARRQGGRGGPRRRPGLAGASQQRDPARRR